MKIENKEMLLYSMNQAYDELYETIKRRDADESEVYFRLGSCLVVVKLFCNTCG